MLKCRNIVEQASAYIDGELSRKQRAHFGFHLMMCTHCRRFVANFRTVAAHLRACGDAEPTVSEHLVKQIEQQLAPKLNSVPSSGSGSPPKVVALNIEGQVSGTVARMARIHAVQSPSSEAVQTIFQDIEQVLGHVPNLFRTYAHNPAVLAGNWNKVKSIMLQGSLSRKLKEAIALVVSEDNGCTYCVTHHSQALKEMGVDPLDNERIRRDPLSGQFEPKERALLALARQANYDPHGPSDELVRVARQSGASDADIIEALAVMEIYTAANKFIDVLDIPLEQV